jgi:hypothetical protein
MSLKEYKFIQEIGFRIWAISIVLGIIYLLCGGGR